MRKILVLLLVTILSVVCLTSCKLLHSTFNIGEHTYEYIQYETGHFKQYTCGCPSPEIMGEHYDHDENNICDACGYDMRLRVVNDILRNQAGCEWLNEISAEDIAEVKIINQYVGVAPGRFKKISSSTDKSVIERIFGHVFLSEVISISPDKAMVAGGSAVTVKFILNDGTERRIYLNNGNYWDTEGNVFTLLYIPQFEETDNTTKSYGFITYTHRGIVYDGEIAVCEISVDELEFIEVVDDIELGNRDLYYCVDTQFGKLNFVSDEYFYIERDEKVFYQLIGKNLDQLIAEYSVINE